MQNILLSTKTLDLPKQFLILDIDGVLKSVYSCFLDECEEGVHMGEHLHLSAKAMIASVVKQYNLGIFLISSHRNTPSKVEAFIDDLSTFNIASHFFGCTVGLDPDRQGQIDYVLDRYEAETGIRAKYAVVDDQAYNYKPQHHLQTDSIDCISIRNFMQLNSYFKLGCIVDMRECAVEFKVKSNLQ